MQKFIARTLSLLLLFTCSCRSPRDVAQGAPAWYESHAFWMGTATGIGGGYLTNATGDDVDSDVVLGVGALLFAVGWFFGNEQDLKWAELTQETPPWLLENQPGTYSQYQFRENVNR